MKSRSLLMLILLPAFFAVSGLAQDVYNNGAINGNIDAWTINFGFIVSDTFTISGGNTDVTGLSFGAWLYPGDTLSSVEVVITSQENFGTTYFDQVVNFTQTGCATNQYGFNVCTETGTFNAGVFANGTYWLNLENASVPSGDPVYWDENDGKGCTSQGCPSSPSENSVGTIGSEAFTVYGSATTTSTTTSVPEPSSLMLFGSGILGFRAFVRRKLM